MTERVLGGSRPQESLVNKEVGSRALADIAVDGAREIVDCEFLDRLAQGKLSEKQWHIFAEQRYLVALPFENMLRTAIDSAKDVGDAELSEKLESNLNDEIGIVDGHRDATRAHATWRQDFYNTLGLSESALQKAVPSKGAQTYVDQLEALIAKSDPFELAGALLVLERSIVDEFAKLEAGMKASFYDRFYARDEGNAEDVAKPSALYIVDHKRHDPYHYSDILQALQKNEGDPQIMTRIRMGAEKLTTVKRQFYKELGQIL